MRRLRPSDSTQAHALRRQTQSMRLPPEHVLRRFQCCTSGAAMAPQRGEVVGKGRSQRVRALVPRWMLYAVSTAGPQPSSAREAGRHLVPSCVTCCASASLWDGMAVSIPDCMPVRLAQIQPGPATVCLGGDVHLCLAGVRGLGGGNMPSGSLRGVQTLHQGPVPYSDSTLALWTGRRG